MNSKFIKRILLGSLAWITWGMLFTVFTVGVNHDDGTGSQIGWIAVGFTFLIISLSVSFIVSLVLIVKLKSQDNTSRRTHTWPFLINYSFSIFCMYLVLREGVTLELFAYYGLLILLPQTMLLIIFLALQRKYLSAHA
jgi:hypothetical protein